MSYRLILYSFGNILILLSLIMWVPLAFTLIDGRDTFAFFCGDHHDGYRRFDIAFI